MRYPYALQLYSVRDHLERNAAETLRRIKEIGFDFVEPAGTAGLLAKEFGSLLRQNDLRAVSAHIPYTSFVQDLDQVIRDAAELELTFVVMPWLGEEEMPDFDAWRGAARALDYAGSRLRQEGIRLCYHNHEHEFHPINGTSVFQMLLDETEPENVAIELDAGWATFAGEDAAAWIQRLRDRVPLLHIKDLKKTEGGAPLITELGRGMVDWDAVLRAGQATGVEWYIVEQDESEQDTLVSAAQNFRFMEDKNR